VCYHFLHNPDWIGLFARLGLPIRELREPLSPDTGKPLSLVFVLG